MSTLELGPIPPHRGESGLAITPPTFPHAHASRGSTRSSSLPSQATIITRSDTCSSRAHHRLTRNCIGACRCATRSSPIARGVVELTPASSAVPLNRTDGQTRGIEEAKNRSEGSLARHSTVKTRGLAGRRPVAGVTSEAMIRKHKHLGYVGSCVSGSRLHSTAQRAVPPALSVIFRPSIRRIFGSRLDCARGVRAESRDELAASPSSSIAAAAGA